MKRMTYFVMALALVLGLAQCKKEQIEPQNEGDVVMITLNVGGDASTGSATNGSKAVVTPPHVSFEKGDTILVASGGKYAGYLTKNETNFSGGIPAENLVENEPLYFYFLGNKIKMATLTSGATEECTVNISDQSAYPTLPVIAMGRSIDSQTGEIINYVPGMTSFTSRLYNKASLMKFNVTTPSTAAICITGMNNKVTVDFGNPTDSGFEYGMEGEGVIKMKGGSGTNVEKWAIVLPQSTALSEGENGSAYSADGNYIGKRPAIAPIVSNTFYNEDTRTMNVNTLSPDGPLATPLTLEVITDGIIMLNKPQSGMQYSLNGGGKITIETTSATTISDLVAGDKVQFYGNGTSITSYKAIRIAGTATVKAYGNIMSLVDEENFASASTLNSEAFSMFFYGNTNLTDASGLQLPATTLAKSCYQEMFRGCSNLTAAPVLPATTLAESCYGGMFYGCSGLTATPALPATTMVTSCYSNMFYNCTGLTTAPVLPATDLAEGCYSNMFNGCRNLTAAPALPATTLAINCYNSMFRNCTYLTSAPVLSAPALVYGCYQYMFESCLYLSNITCLATSGINVSRSTGSWLNNTGLNVSGTKTFTRDSSTTVSETSTGTGSIWPRSSHGIPTGWEVEIYVEP